MKHRKIVFASIGSLGDLYPFLALGQAFAQKGYLITIATTLNHRNAVENAGLSFHAIRPHPPDDPDFGRKFSHPSKGPAFVFRDYLSPSIRESYEDLLTATRDADMLVSQSLVLAAPLVAEITGVRWISAVLQPFSFFSVFDPPRVPSIPFVRAGLLKPETAQMVNTRIRDHAKQWTLRWVTPVIELRRSLGIGDGAHPIYEGQHSPRKVLAMFPSFVGAPQADWLRGTVQTGAVFYNDPTPVDPALEAFLSNGPPPVAFTLGSSSCRDPGRFFETSVRAAQKAGLRAVLITGGESSIQSKRDIFICRYAPYGKVFPRAAVIVHAGGIGTTLTAARSGRPQLIVPFAHDQADNAYRAEAAGLAVRLSKRGYASGAVAGRLTRIMDDRAMLDRCAAGAQDMTTQDGLQNAVSEIERSFDV